MSLAAETRDAVRARPFLYDALRAGVLNYTATARYLDLGDEEAVAAALRRYREDLPPPVNNAGDPRVTMQRGFGPVAPSDALLVAGDTALGPAEGASTAITATGEVGPTALGRVLRRLAVEGIDATAAAAVDGTLVVTVDHRAGPSALRLVEDAC